MNTKVANMNPKYLDISNRQTGAALIVSLLLLIVVTILGISGMRSTTLEEKMASNMHDVQLAFHAAESALREGEGKLQLPTLPAFNDTNGYYQPDALLWQTIDWDPANGDVIAVNTSYDVAEQPSFYIEEMPATSFGGSIEAGASLTTGTYRITARGVGGSSTSQVILQETFRR